MTAKPGLVRQRPLTYCFPMRVFLVALLALAATTFAHAADVTIAHVWPGYRSADSFKRISEYFTGRENTSGQIVLRTQPDSRAGYYFLVRVKNTGGELAGAHVELKVVTPFTPEIRTYTFACPLPAGENALNLGLTGTDWPEQPKAEAVAWQLRLLTADGTELAKEQSFLWALPAQK